jgi:hypothetical protein
MRAFNQKGPALLVENLKKIQKNSFFNILKFI